MTDLKGLIVSCQAVPGEPLYGYHLMGIMAKAAVEGGAVAIRTSGVEDIESVKNSVDVPVIGLIKRCYADSPVYITPTRIELDALLASRCDVIALDATHRRRPGGEPLDALVQFSRERAPRRQLMADVSTVDEGVYAEELGFEYVSTTLRGYTENTKGIPIPDYTMIRELVKRTRKARVIAEGGIWELEQLKRILDLGVYGVVIGTAVTRPREITAHFAQAYEARAEREERASGI